MTPAPDIEPIREGLEKAMRDAGQEWLNGCYAAGYIGMGPEHIPDIVRADACLTYLIKRQAFHSDAYAVIKKEGLGK